jgi:hypothetical protein
MTDWALVILTALGSGALGAIVTTYGTQTRERRQARTQVREALRQVQNLMRHVPTYEQLTAALDNLETSAMLARLPQELTGLNRDALHTLREHLASVAEPHPSDGPELADARSDTAFLSDHIAGETIQLFIDATWHPILSAPRRWWRTRQLSRVMDTYPRPGPRLRDKRRWERDTIRRAKRDRKRRRFL